MEEMRKNTIISADTHFDPIIEVGTEIKLSSFYYEIDKYAVPWMELDGWSKRMLEKICTNAYTKFSYELQSMAAAMAVISTNPVIYRSPFTRFLTYRHGLGTKWLTLLFEIYINEGQYIWIRNNRLEQIHQLLMDQSVDNPIVDYLESRIDSAVMEHYVGWDLVSVIIDKFAIIPRGEWHNKKPVETGLVKFSVINS